MDGNSTTVDPVKNQGESSQPANDNQGQGQVDVAALQKKLEDLEGKYSASSREAHKLVEDLKQEREARIRLEGSLKKDSEAQNRFPNEDEYVKYYTELGQSPEIARAEYKEKRINYDNQQILYKQTLALQNLLRYQAEEQNRLAYATNEDAKKAHEFFQGLPEFESMPIADKIQRMNDLKGRMGVRIEGRDTTQAKLAASGGNTSGSGRAGEAPDTSHLDSEAKRSGFSCWKELEDAQKLSTPESYAEYKRKWKR